MIKIKKRLQYGKRFLILYFSLPESVEVAIGVGGDKGIALGECEGYLGLAREIFLLASLCGFDGNPTDVVFGKHRVKGRAYSDLNVSVFIFRDNGKVLFGSGFGGVGNELLHFLSTANNLNAARFKIFYDIAAMFTLIKFHIDYLPF